MYNMFRLGSVIIPRLPRWFILALSMIIGAVAWLVAGKARKQATINMMHILGPQIQSTRAGRRKLRRTVRGMFQNSVRNYSGPGERRDSLFGTFWAIRLPGPVVLC